LFALAQRAPQKYKNFYYYITKAAQVNRIYCVSSLFSHAKTHNLRFAWRSTLKIQLCRFHTKSLGVIAEAFAKSKGLNLALIMLVW